MNTFDKIAARQLVLIASMAALLSGCLSGSQKSPGDDGQSNKYSLYDVNMYPLNSLSCDPMGGGGTPTVTGGLKADLYYLSKDQPRYKKVNDYISSGKKSAQYFFFTDVNVPTRLFNTGFPLETGDLIKNDEGETLVEYFALRYATVLRLGANDAEGDYELALLSDDGAIMRIRGEDGEYRTVVDNDGDHPTRLGCGKDVIHMTKDTEHLVQLDYYQGPRYHISVIPLWRKIDGARKAEKDCGVTGNETWFDYNNQSKPTKKYNDLLARGWKPIGKENYLIPNTYYFNPCVPGVAPVISQFAVTMDEVNGILRATWSTDIPATSQLRYIESVSGAEVLTESDNILRTQHEISVQLSNRGLYYVQGVSISISYGKSLSPFLEALWRVL